MTTPEYELHLEVKTLDEQGTFSGLAAVYGNTDRQGDRIEAGAFSADSGKEFPLLWSHKTDEVVGVVKVTETDEGLLAEGRLLLDTEPGRTAYSRLKAGAAKGLSIGFRLLKHAFEGAVRVIKEGVLAEVSLTSFPSNPGALVLQVKQDDCPLRDVARVLRPDWNLFQPPS